MSKQGSNFSELKQSFREFKLRVLSEDFTFNVDTENLRRYSTEIDFILNSELKDDIITGSLALSMFGLLHRQIKDIDILIKDKDRYPMYIRDDYNVDEGVISNRLGFVRFRYKPGLFYRERNFEVDFFHNCNNASFIEIKVNSKNLKIHNPLEILSNKIDIVMDSNRSSYKHYQDLSEIFESYLVI